MSATDRVTRGWERQRGMAISPRLPNVDDLLGVRSVVFSTSSRHPSATVWAADATLIFSPMYWPSLPIMVNLSE